MQVRRQGWPHHIVKERGARATAEEPVLGAILAHGIILGQSLIFRVADHLSGRPTRLAVERNLSRA